MRVFFALAVLAFPVPAVLAAPVPLQAQTEVVAPLPRPTGASTVGTTVAYFFVTARSDKDFPKGRPLDVQLWYPARDYAKAPKGARSGAQMAPYLWETKLRAAMIEQQYYGMDSLTVNAWAQVDTHSLRDAPVAAGKHPLLAFSVGLGVARAHYTSIAEELASHGYIVALVESPLQGFMVDGRGQMVLDTIGLYGEPAAHRAGVNAWSTDISFIADKMKGAKATSAFDRVSRTVNWLQVGALGHSSGGIVALQTCERDKRFKACIDLDGGLVAPTKEPLADLVVDGTTKPALIIREQPLYDDSVFVRRKTTREQWEKGGEAGKAAFEEFTKRAKAPLHVLFVAGTGHFSFTDGPFVMPSTISRFGGRSIEANRGWGVITGTIVAWFDEQLRGRNGALEAFVRATPELSRSPK